MAAETRGRTLTRMLIAIFEGDEGRGVVQLPRLIGRARGGRDAARLTRPAASPILSSAATMSVAGERGRHAGSADDGDGGRGVHGAGGAVELGPAQEARLLDALGAESGVQQVLRDP